MSDTFSRVTVVSSDASVDPITKDVAAKAENIVVTNADASTTPLSEKIKAIDEATLSNNTIDLNYFKMNGKVLTVKPESLATKLQIDDKANKVHAAATSEAAGGPASSVNWGHVKLKQATTINDIVAINNKASADGVVFDDTGLYQLYVYMNQYLSAIDTLQTTVSGVAKEVNQAGYDAAYVSGDNVSYYVKTGADV